MINVEKAIDRSPVHLRALNNLSIITLAICNEYSGVEYEINDGKIVAEIVNVK